jgi:tetratricopeptide (TPR) repeat protein
VRKRKARAPAHEPASASFSRWAPLVAFLALVFVLKLIVLLQLRDHPLLQPQAGLDTTVYTDLARAAVEGNVLLGPGLYYVSPLYIYFVALVLAVADSMVWVRVVQIVLGTLAVGLIFQTAQIWHGRRAAWVAAVLAALTGLFTFYEVLLLQAALEPVLTALVLASLARALTSERRMWFAAAGMAFGIQTMNRPNVLMAAFGVALLLVVVRRWRSALFLAAGVVIALLPITARNYVVAGDVSPVSSHGGLNFYIGNNAEADGTYHMVAGITPSIAGQKDDARRVAEQAIGRRLDDSEVSAHFYGLGWSWIRQHPLDAAWLFARKLAYTFNAATLSLNYSYSYYRSDERSFLRFLPVGAWLLIPLGLLGLWLGAPADPDHRRAFLVWASFIPVYAVAVAIFFVSSRYRLPLLVALCVTAGGAVDALIRLAAPRPSRAADEPSGSGTTRRLAVALVALVALGVAANWPFGLDDGRSEERLRMALVLVGQERYGEAEARFADLVREHPEPGVARFRFGRALLAKKQPSAAIRHLEEAARIDPGQAENSFALGQALLDAGRPKDAVPHLRRAYDAGIRTDLAGFDLARALGMSGDRAGAIRVLQDVRPARPDDAASWFALGDLSMQLDAPRLAEAFLRRAVQAAPTVARTHQQLGLALANQNRVEEAAVELAEAVRLDPRDAAARLNYAVALAETGKVAESREQTLEALRLRPDYARAREFLGVLDKGKGR